MKSNLYKKFRTVAFTAGLVCVSMYAMTNAGGPPAENTGAPGDNTCGQSGCHSFSPITSGPNWNNITLTSNVPASGYVPGNSYSLTITHTQPGHSVFGFQTTIQDVNGVNAGTLTNGTGSSAQTVNGKIYVNHASGGTSGSGTRSWTFGWTAPSSGMGALTMYVAVNAANGDATSSGDTIFTKGFVLYQTGTAPPTAIASADKSTVCQNDTVRFTGGGLNNPTGFMWSIPSATFVLGTSQTSQNPVVIFSGSSGNKSVSLITSNANGNSQLASLSILVNALPANTTTPSGNVSICGNDSLTITAASGSGYTYLWSPGAATTQSIKVGNSGSYNVKVTNTNTGCVRTSGNVVVTKRTLPTVTLSSSTDSICLGDSVTFTATAGMNNYDFYRDTTKVQSGASASFKGAPASAAIQYTVYGTDGNGCKSLVSNAKSITVQTPLAAPTVSCGTTTITSIQFNWTAVSGADGYEASIDTGKTWFTPSSGATGLSHDVTGLTGGTRINLRVRAIQTSGKCSKGDAGVTTCQSTGCAAVTFNLAYDSVYCNPQSTDSATITVGSVNTTNYSVKVDQVSSTGVFIATIYPYSAGNTFKVKLSGTTSLYFRFNVLDSNQVTCPAGTKTAMVKGVFSPATDPTITFGKTGTNVLCDRESATFTFNKPTGTDKYEIMNNTTSLGFTTLQTATYPSSTFATNDMVTVVAINNATGCGRKSSPFTIVRKADPKAGFIITTDSSRVVQFNDTTTGATAWAWKFGDNGTSTVQNPNHTYAINGTYNVTLTVTTGDQCKSDTAAKPVKLNSGLFAIEGVGQVEFYPNPVKNILNIRLDGVNMNGSDMVFEIKDLQGKVVKSYKGNNQSNYQIDMNDLNSAPYILIIKTGNEQKAFPIIKE